MIYPSFWFTMQLALRPCLEILSLAWADLSQQFHCCCWGGLSQIWQRKGSEYTWTLAFSLLSSFPLFDSFICASARATIWCLGVSCHSHLKFMSYLRKMNHTRQKGHHIVVTRAYSFVYSNSDICNSFLQSTVDPWTTWVWIAQVLFCTDFFSINTAQDWKCIFSSLWFC